MVYYTVAEKLADKVHIRATLFQPSCPRRETHKRRSDAEQGNVRRSQLAKGFFLQNNVTSQTHKMKYILGNLIFFTL